MRREFFALFAAAALLLGMSACSTVDNPSSGGGNAQEDPVVAPAQLKHGVWTEYDSLLVASGKYTAEQLAEMPTVGMWIQGDKGYFFTYTAEDMSETVEGQISYNNNTGKGTITFPAIKDSPLSGQTVSFSMMADDVMQFELTYEGQQTTATFAWLCEDLDNWSSDITDEDWLALMAYYETIAAEAGPDASIDWSDSDVEGLDEPLVWDEGDVAQARTRTVGMGAMVVMNILGSLFGEEQYDPKADIQEIKNNLNKITGKLDEVLKGQEQMMTQMDVQFDQIDKHFDKVNERLIAIANKMSNSESLTIMNNRNTTYYNPLNTRNTAYFDDAYKLYNENKDDLSKVSKDLGDYAKEWVGPDGEQYIELTWNYINYLSTVQHSTYGTGLDKIYDGMTFDKYPWEHMGIGDRQTYRDYDMFMITRCLFMITLYASYCDISNVKKNGIYKNYISSLEKIKAFCEFNVANPAEFRVCQIPGAHFVMHKEIQKYNYCGKNNEAPDPALYGEIAVYRPEWHEAGSVKIDNPYDLRNSHLLRCQEYEALYKYYRPAVYPKGDVFRWMDVLIDGKLAAGAVYAKEPNTYLLSASKLLLYDPQSKNTGYYQDYNGVIKDSGSGTIELFIAPLASVSPENIWRKDYHQLGRLENSQNGKSKWSSYRSDLNFYAAIVEQRY